MPHFTCVNRMFFDNVNNTSIEKELSYSHEFLASSICASISSAEKLFRLANSGLFKSSKIFFEFPFSSALPFDSSKTVTIRAAFFRHAQWFEQSDLTAHINFSFDSL